MIDSVSDTLKNFFIGEYEKIFGSDRPNFVIGIFNDNKIPTCDSIALFLYEIYENKEYRSNQMQSTVDFGTMKESSSPPPIMITLNYIVTAWCGNDKYSLTDEEKQRYEQKILGNTMIVAISNPCINEEYIVESIKYEEYLPILLLHKDEKLQISDMWTQLKCMPKVFFLLSVNVWAKPIVKEQTPTALMTQVSAGFLTGKYGEFDNIIRFDRNNEEMDKVASFSGKVLDVDDNNKPIDKACVIVKELGRVGISQSDGTFTICGIEPGKYKLEVYADGYNSVNLDEVKLDFTSSSNILVINLKKK